MGRYSGVLLVILGIIGLSANLALGDPKVEQEPMGPDGDSVGSSISPTGDHAAVLAVKGSHIEILYDNVAGPKVDNLMAIAGGNFQTPTYWSGQIPVLFSDDGAHWAYMAKSGDDCVVMLDGKELTRTPLRQNMVERIPLTFSHGGKHFFYSDQDAQGYHIVVDGKPGPAMQHVPNIAFSPDGEHYAYVGEYTRQGQGVWSFVDGRQVNYFGDIVQYTGKGTLVSKVAIPGGGTGLVFNGKPSIKAMRLDPMWISADGNQIALVITPNTQTPGFLVVNGKVINGTQGLQISKVYFSPNGKRWAALCVKPTGSSFMIVDGKKGEEYQTIQADVGLGDNDMHWRYISGLLNGGDLSAYQPHTPAFTADSSQFVYVAQASGRQFLEIDDNESDGFSGTMALTPVLSTVGNHVGLLGVAPSGVLHVIVDGKDTTYGNFTHSSERIINLTFSPHAKHYAFVRNGVVYLDGVAQPGHLLGQYVFSPDDSHIAYQASMDNPPPCFVVDGKAISTQAGMVGPIFFSPDSKHIYWYSVGNLGAQGTKDSHELYVDGKPTTHYESAANAAKIDYSFSPDDVMTFVAVTDGNVRRFHITPDTTLDAVVAAAPATKAH